MHFFTFKNYRRLVFGWKIVQSTCKNVGLLVTIGLYCFIWLSGNYSSHKYKGFRFLFVWVAIRVFLSLNMMPRNKQHSVVWFLWKAALYPAWSGWPEACGYEDEARIIQSSQNPQPDSIKSCLVKERMQLRLSPSMYRKETKRDGLMM